LMIGVMIASPMLLDDLGAWLRAEARTASEKRELLNSGRVEVASSDGEVIGLALYDVEKGGELWKLGFRSGDVIVKVEGDSIRSGVQAAKALRTILREHSVSISVRAENGVYRNLTIRRD